MKAHSAYPLPGDLILARDRQLKADGPRSVHKKAQVTMSQTGAMADCNALDLVIALPVEYRYVAAIEADKSMVRAESSTPQAASRRLSRCSIIVSRFSTICDSCSMVRFASSSCSRMCTKAGIVISGA